MNRLPPTAPSLLVRLRDADDGPAWNQFIEIYSPVVYRYARRRGLQDADAADLMQDVLGSVANRIRKFEYEPSRGLFRAWLFTIVRNKVADAATRRRRHPEERTAPVGLAQDSAEFVDDDTDDEGLWEREYRLRLLNWGLDQIRNEFEETTWRAFLLAAMERRPAREVSEQLGLSVGAVYIAKSRVLQRLKERLHQVDEGTPSFE